MACRLLGAKPLPESMTIILNWTARGLFSQILTKIRPISLGEIYLKKKSYANVGHFVEISIR